MAKKLIRRWLPNLHCYRDHLHLNRVFGGAMAREHLWHINRRSVAVAVAVGLFCAFMPVPVQMLLAAAGAILLQGNLPIAVVTVWVTNPVTAPPIFFFCFKVGQLLLGWLSSVFYFETTLEWMDGRFNGVWQPLLLGCLVVGFIAAALGYIAVRFLWRYHVTIHWTRRKRNRV